VSFKSLITGFLESVERFPSRAALFVGGEAWTYVELHRRANAIASTILLRQGTASPLAAILAYRSLTSYAGILGILDAGKGYVPLNPKFPLERTRKMLEISGCSVLIVGRESVLMLPELLMDFPRSLTAILPDTDDATALMADFPDHEFVPASLMSRGCDIPCSPAVKPEAVAYLLFTSGSSGEPKGVPITNLNVRSYVDYTCDRYEVSEHDRFSQEFDMTFDLSVHDMFVCWERGACLYTVPDKATMLPAKFIRDHRLTMWFSVPSVAGVLARTRLLQPGAFPSLRYSLFCGEPLAAKYAQLWQEAAPQSVVENLYGPTEATIAISQYRWDRATSTEECPNGIVPIGWIFNGQKCCVLDSERTAVSLGELGELCLGGPQVSSRYWNNPQKTLEQFIRVPNGDNTMWYRTGDLVRQREDGCLIYGGRVDHQVKIRGYRVELQEVEGVLRRHCKTEQVVAIPWPTADGTAEGLVAFVSGVAKVDSQHVLESCRLTLPDYLIPQKIHVLEEMPCNANGKVDRLKLKQMLGSS
jgi:amino acid adenylation domain-containing protein